MIPIPRKVVPEGRNTRSCFLVKFQFFRRSSGGSRGNVVVLGEIHVQLAVVVEVEYSDTSGNVYILSSNCCRIFAWIRATTRILVEHRCARLLVCIYEGRGCKIFVTVTIYVDP